MRVHGDRVLRNAGRVVWVSSAVVLLAACAADSDARGIADAGRSERREATTPAFIDAYEAGFQRGVSDGRVELARDTDREDSVEVGLAERWQSLSGIEVPAVEDYVRSGKADAWLETRYRDLGIVRRDLAAAHALLFLTHWEAFTGTTADRVQSDGARRQIEAFLADSGSRESSADVETRRRVYELMAATLSRESQRIRTRGDAADVAEFTQAVRSDFQRLSSNDLAGFTLTDDGFQER